MHMRSSTFAIVLLLIFTYALHAYVSVATVDLDPVPSRAFCGGGLKKILNRLIALVRESEAGIVLF